MAKKATAQTRPNESSDANKGKKRATAAAEIDDIFAAKKPKLAPTGDGRTKTDATKQQTGTEIATSTSAATPTSKQARKKQKSVQQSSAQVPQSEQALVRQPETVVDTSSTVVTFQDPLAAPQSGPAGLNELDSAAADEERRFMDSRGNTRRKTEDGLPIYSVAELKIGLGGDTKDCPFDCWCCF
ncbi:hypothetical protein ACM66B_001862 [Microbotryomycetes sp. NB124-2]